MSTGRMQFILYVMGFEKGDGFVYTCMHTLQESLLNVILCIL